MVRSSTAREIPEANREARARYEQAAAVEKEKQARWLDAISEHARNGNRGDKHARGSDLLAAAVNDARTEFETAQGVAHQLYLRMVNADAAVTLARETAAREAAEAEAERLRRLRPPRARPLGDRVREALANLGKPAE